MSGGATNPGGSITTTDGGGSIDTSNGTIELGTDGTRFTINGSLASTNRAIYLPDADGTFALTANKLSAFAATTSAELAGVISDETGSGKLIFSEGTFASTTGQTYTFPTTTATLARTDAAQTFTGVQTITGTTQNSLFVSATSATNAASPTNCVAVFQQGPGTGVGVFTDAAINLRATAAGAYVNAFIGSSGAGIIDISGSGSSSALRVRDSNSPNAGTVGVSLTAAGNITAICTLAVTGATTLTGAVTTANFIAGVEMTPPSAPAANGYRIYAEDNGAGKTRLMVLFASGAAQQIALQP